MRKNPKSISWGKLSDGRVTGTSGTFIYLLRRSYDSWHAYVKDSRWGAHADFARIIFDEDEDDAATLYEAKNLCDDFNRLSDNGKFKKLNVASEQSSIEKADTRTLYNLYRKLSNAEFRDRQTGSEEDLYLTRFQIAKELEKRGWFGNDVMSSRDSGPRTGSLRQMRANGRKRWPRF